VAQARRPQSQRRRPRQAGLAQRRPLPRASVERLAQTDPDNTGWQRDLSVSYNKIGDVLVAQGNLPEALQLFRDDLVIAERLAEVDPNNAG
jgi:hypothetical protein